MPFKLPLLGLTLLSYASSVTSLYTNISGTYREFAAATYMLTDSYTSANFFSDFNFFTGTDPTHGFVNYQDETNALNSGLVNTNNGQIYLGVDHTTVNPSAPGRASVRLTSNTAYTHGLFIADIAHMQVPPPIISFCKINAEARPGSICGVWPSWWMFGPNWPDSGEIDIIEGVNTATTNTITLHTSAGCNINIAGSQSSTVLEQSNCNEDNGNTGCGTTNTVPNAYGNSFNLNGGGVYAMQWESSGIYVWFFPRGQIPADITAGAPVTGNWGTPIVAFNSGSGCNIDSYFVDQNIVFDTTFCGDWAGTVWSDGSCASLASSCTNYVAANPGAFAPAYWLINSVKVYHQ